MNIVKTAYEKALHYFQTSDGKVWDSTGTSGTVDNSAIKNKGSSLDGLYSYHNHPSGETLSPEDLMNISSKNNMVSLTATGNNAKLFSIVKTESADSYGYAVFLRDKVTEKRFFNKSFSYLDVKEFDLDQLPENLSKPLRNELLSFCKECVSGGKNYGYSYFKS